MALSVAIESPLQDEVRGLIASLNAYLAPLAPPEFCFAMTVEEMAGSDTTVFIARDDEGRAVGCGALKVHDARLGEIKRMFTLPQVRGQRAGAAVLEAIEAAARDKGLSVLMLETGPRETMQAAHRLYERSGFAARGPFLDYPESPYSEFYEKAL